MTALKSKKSQSESFKINLMEDRSKVVYWGSSESELEDGTKSKILLTLNEDNDGLIWIGIQINDTQHSFTNVKGFYEKIKEIVE